MAKLIDITGQKFGRLTVLSYSHTNDKGKACWKCLCECGNVTIVPGKLLRDGNTKSCGCLSIELFKERATTHGMSKTGEFQAWVAMRVRCNGDPKLKSYINYGARGIVVCPEWQDDFAQFFADMGPKPSPKHSLDRIDNDKGYYKENCRWATREEQNNNTRSVKTITLKGKTMSISLWSKESGISRVTISKRLKNGLSPKDILCNKHLKHKTR